MYQDTVSEIMKLPQERAFFHMSTDFSECNFIEESVLVRSQNMCTEFWVGFPCLSVLSWMGKFVRLKESNLQAVPKREKMMSSGVTIVVVALSLHPAWHPGLKPLDFFPPNITTHKKWEKKWPIFVIVKILILPYIYFKSIYKWPYMPIADSPMMWKSWVQLPSSTSPTWAATHH